MYAKSDFGFYFLIPEGEKMLPADTMHVMHPILKGIEPFSFCFLFLWHIAQREPAPLCRIRKAVTEPAIH